ncbi:MAG: AI-2E family transporter [Candidatus Gracilibacteria bacterium]|nr:AI-2E family transporter [Candidatus Gracilibacteria bacterium]
MLKKFLVKAKKENNEYLNFFIKLNILLAFLVLVYLFYKIINIIGVFILACFLSLVFSPFLNKMNKHKIPDWLGIIFIYLILLIFIFIVTVAVIPIFIDKITAFIDFLGSGILNIKDIYTENGIYGFGLPPLLEKILTGALKNVDLNIVFNFLQNNFASIGGFLGNNFGTIASSGIGVISSITGIIFNIFLMFILNLFIILERQNIKILFYDLLPYKATKYLKNREGEIINSLYYWIKGQLILMFVMFLITFLGLNFLRLFGINIDGIFTLSLITGLMEFIPMVGFIISILTAIAISAQTGFVGLIAVLILYVILQQLEGNIIVPFLMKKNLNLSPVFVLIVMTVGGTLYGILGMMLAIPIATIIQIFIKDFIERKSK